MYLSRTQYNWLTRLVTHRYHECWLTDDEIVFVKRVLLDRSYTGNDKVVLNDIANYYTSSDLKM